MQTTPIAKPTGHRLGGGRCGLPWPCWGSTLERLPVPAHLVGFNRLGAAPVNDVTDAATIREKCFALFAGWLLPSLCSGEIKASKAISRPVLRGICPDRVFLPAAVDQCADLRAHLDLLGPRPRALVRAFRGRVDAELATEELMR